MRHTTLPAPRQTTPLVTESSAFPDFYAEERRALARTRARQARARNALVLVGLMAGVAGLAGALRAWDAGLQP